MSERHRDTDRFDERKSSKERLYATLVWIWNIIHNPDEYPTQDREDALDLGSDIETYAKFSDDELKQAEDDAK